MLTKQGYLAPGTPVEVTRINRDVVQGRIGEGPLEHLKGIGEFYHVTAGEPIKCEQTLKQRVGKQLRRHVIITFTNMIGTYDRGSIRVVEESK